MRRQFRGLIFFCVFTCFKTQLIRDTRKAIPEELFRDHVEPAKGGKVPEAAHMRIELNKLDAAGLEGGEGIRMMKDLVDESPILPERASVESDYNPGYSPPLKLKPYYQPLHVPEPFLSDLFSSVPKPDNHKEYLYELQKPIYEKPVGPVLLQHRPNEVKSIQPVPITINDGYSKFDCRNVPYSNRHYADPDTGCQIYHFCHADGKQDTFECSYGTIFNEYLGTCDYKSIVRCGEKNNDIPNFEYNKYDLSTFHKDHEITPSSLQIKHYDTIDEIFFQEKRNTAAHSFKTRPRNNIQSFTQF